MPVFALPFQGRRCVSVCFGQAPTAQLRRALAHALDPKAHRVPLTLRAPSTTKDSRASCFPLVISTTPEPVVALDPFLVVPANVNDSALSVSCSRSTNTSRLSLLPRLACPSSHPDRPFASNVAPSRRARTKSLFADSRQSSRKRALPYIQTGVVCLGPRTAPKDSGRRRGARVDGSDEGPRQRDMPDTGPSCRTDRSRIGLIRVPCDIEIDTARASLSIQIPATSVRMDEEPLAFASTDRVTTLQLR